ncbi:MAG TPA: hypothetical protein VMV02_03700 [Acidimicrobiales bacterium]|nr:hypothetical protein [Acidimicrobiales bacterium]
MGHVPEGALRRLLDEPLAVPDTQRRHLGACARCRASSRRVAGDREVAVAHMARPLPVPDLDLAWARVERRLSAAGEVVRAPDPPRRWRAIGVTARGGAIAVAAGSLAVDAAAAATLTTVFAPTHVAPLPLQPGDLHAFASSLGFAAPSGGSTLAWADGTIRWHRSAAPLRTTSLAAAEAAAGIPVSLPTSLPNGVADSPSLLVEPAATAVVSFDGAAGAVLAGSTLTLSVGPVVLATYGGAGLRAVPALAVVTMPRPTATTTGATTSELESFLLAQPGLPSDLATGIRLLGNLETALPVPTPPGFVETSTTVGGPPGVLLSGQGGGAAAAICEDAHGVVHTVGGLLDENDVLGVARQIG